MVDPYRHPFLLEMISNFTNLIRPENKHVRILYLTYMTAGVGQTLRSLECAKAASDLGHEVTLIFMNRYFRAPGFCYDMMENYRSDRFQAIYPPRPEHSDSVPEPAKRRKAAIGRIVEAKPTIRGLYRQIAGSLRFVPRELAAVDRFKPDVLVVRPDQVLSFMVTSKLRKVPLVMETDGPVEELDSRWGLDSRWVRPLDTWRARRAGALLYISTLCGELWLRKKIQVEKLFHAPNGVDPRVFKPSDPGKRLALRAQYGLADSKVIGFSGNMREWHGIDQLIAAALPLLRRDPLIKLLFIGAVDDPGVIARLEVPEEIRKRQFVFTGILPYLSMGEHIDIADCMALPFPHSDFFFPSAMKLFEAMSVGKVIVAPRMGQIEELLSGLDSPFLYDPREPGELSRCLEAALERASNASGEIAPGSDARARIESGHTWAHRGGAVVQACEFAISRFRSKRKRP